MSYIPVPAIHIGKLPNIPGTNVNFNYSETAVPGDATEIFVYSFATTHDASGKFRRLFFEMFTTGDKGVQYKQYMNIAVGPSIACNSENMWFPVTKNRILTVKLDAASECDGCKCIAYKKKGAKADDMSEFSDVFVIGYRR